MTTAGATKDNNNIQSIVDQIDKAGRLPAALIAALNAKELTWQDALKQAISANPRHSWDNGDRYKGQDRVNGMGACLWSRGDMFFGSYRENKINGYGIGITVDGETVSNCPDCKFYAGNWSDNVKNGAGSCYDATGKLLYRGEFKDNRPVGVYPSTDDNAAYRFTIIVYGDGSKYIGETFNGRMHGYGIFVWQTGELWIGWFKDGTRDGAGLSIHSDGKLVTGTWQGNTHTPSETDITWDMLKQAISANPTTIYDNGRYKGQNMSNGMGAYLWNDGSMSFGNYRKKIFNGYGIAIMNDVQTINNCPGCKYYAGNWSNDVKSGAGSCFDASGKLLYRGEFRDDRPVDAYPSTDDNAAYKFEIIHYTDGKYIGETFNGRGHGYGIYVWQTGDLWFGWWKDGIRDGTGLLIYNNGKLLTGTWKGDKHAR